MESGQRYHTRQQGIITKHEMVDLMGGRFDLARNGLRGHGCGKVAWVVDLRSAQTTAFRRRRSCWVEVDLVPGAPRWCGERYAAGAWSGSFRCLVAEALDATVGRCGFGARHGGYGVAEMWVRARVALIGTDHLPVWCYGRWMTMRRFASPSCGAPKTQTTWHPVPGYTKRSYVQDGSVGPEIQKINKDEIDHLVRAPSPSQFS